MLHHRVWGFIAETAAPGDAARLREAALRTRGEGPRLALARGELFVLMAADDEPLDRFVEPVAALLA